MIQLSLLQDTQIKKSIITVPIEQLTVSRFNPRATRSNEDIDRLAQRIANNGFEITRALWAHKNGSGYEVFAGGTRLEAAKRAGVKKVPVVLHDGASDEDIVRLAYEDNDNDEYHTPVSIVDVWADYARLVDEGWQRKKIAEVMDVSQKTVSIRLRLHSLPDVLKEFLPQGKLTEAHLKEISEFYPGVKFHSWITDEQAHLELARQAVKRNLTKRQTEQLVTKWKEMLALATDLHQQLPEPYQPVFVDSLAKISARTQAEVQAAYNTVTEQMLAKARERELELARQQNEAEAERLRLEQERVKQEQIQSILDNIIHGDFTEVCQSLEDESVDVIITDPPYPIEFLPLYEKLAQQARRVLKPGGSMLVMCGQSYLPEILQLMTPHLNYYWTLSYQTPGAQSPNVWSKNLNSFWKPVLWFVNGEYTGDWIGDVIKSDVNDNDKNHHYWGQSESGIARLVEKFTQPGEVVLDPFFGGGTTGLVALQLGRQFIGIDNDEAAIKTSRERIFSYLNEG